MEIRIPDLNSIDTAAEQFVNNMGNRRIFAFYGKMGAGKTTFIRAVCHKLGVEEEVTSPSFAIVNEYRSDTLGESIFHFDFIYGGTFRFLSHKENRRSLRPWLRRLLLRRRIELYRVARTHRTAASRGHCKSGNSRKFRWRQSCEG